MPYNTHVCTRSARKHPVSVSLQSILEKHFPAQTADRKAETTLDVDHGPSVLPLFIVDYVLPGQVSKSSSKRQALNATNMLSLWYCGHSRLRSIFSSLAIG